MKARGHHWRAIGAMLRRIETTDPGVLRDVDTPEDLAG
jgi:CTP:molybdopterin cytidylyltransferase MocA